MRSDSEDAEQVAPRETSAPPASTPPTPPTPAPREPRDPLPGEADGAGPRFGTCEEAVAHGYGLYSRGWDPEYHWYPDRDHDGMNCEPWLTDLPPGWTESPPPLETPTERRAAGTGAE